LLCSVSFMLNATCKLSMLNVVTLNVVMLCVVMLSVVAPSLSLSLSLIFLVGVILIQLCGVDTDREAKVS
jgi:hypothetical protein